MDFSWGKKGSFLGIGCSVDSLEQRETKKEGFAWKTALGKGNPALKIPGFSGGGFEAFQNPIFLPPSELVTRIPCLGFSGSNQC